MVTTYEPRSIIACIDGSAHTQAVLNAAIWSAQTLHAPIGLLHAHDQLSADRPQDLSGNIGFDSSDILLGELAKLDAERNALVREHGEVLLTEAAQYIATHPLVQDPDDGDADVLSVFKLHRHESLKMSIGQLQSDVQMVILGKQGSADETPHEQIGSQLETAIRSASQPVLVVTEDFSPPETALYAFDNRSNTLQGLQWLAGHPLFRDVHIHIAYIAEDTPQHQDILRSATAKLKQQGLTVTPQLLQGSAKKDLLRYQREQGLDMMIMGAYGHSRLREFFMGSTTQTILQETHHSILMLRF